MIVQQRLQESQYNIRYDDEHNAFIIAIREDDISDEIFASEAIKDIILEIDTEAEDKL